MSERVQTSAVIVKRTNFGEADRVIQFFTRDFGKVSGIAKGVRKPKSKLAGGLELFSICDIGLVRPKSGRDLYTVVSARLDKHFANIVTDFQATNQAYMYLKLIHLFSESEHDHAQVFEVLAVAFTELDAKLERATITSCWFIMQLLKLHGVIPNLIEDNDGAELTVGQRYGFSIEDGLFFAASSGQFGETEIKAWRVFLQADLTQLRRISGLLGPAEVSLPILEQFALFHA